MGSTWNDIPLFLLISLETITYCSPNLIWISVLSLVVLNNVVQCDLHNNYVFPQVLCLKKCHAVNVFALFFVRSKIMGMRLKQKPKFRVKIEIKVEFQVKVEFLTTTNLSFGQIIRTNFVISPLLSFYLMGSAWLLAILDLTC